MAPLMHAAETSALPLFPLHNVLLPGAAMGLRVFERRYLDLVRESGRNGTSFGVCLILDGTEVGAPATPAAFGTEVRIEDFDVGADGVLVLRLRGTRRFHVQRSRIRDNGLVVGEVNWCEPDSDDELRPEHSLLATVLERMLEQVGAIRLGGAGFAGSSRLGGLAVGRAVAAHRTAASVAVAAGRPASAVEPIACVDAVTR